MKPPGKPGEGGCVASRQAGKRDTATAGRFPEQGGKQGDGCGFERPTGIRRRQDTAEGRKFGEKLPCASLCFPVFIVSQLS